MFIARFGIVGLLIEKGVEAIADRLFKSPLEQDLGEAGENDIILPHAHCIFQGEVDEFTPRLRQMFPMIDGLEAMHLDRVLQRLVELKRNRSATYLFQINDSGTPVELQMILTRYANRQVQIDFRCSESVIRLIELAFSG
ncbi:MAG: hypothetical protein H7A51_12740 [Akkermansiaceae bacterium]|nr:hypothetical protein [Akkermansiaceae bacterium]